MGPAPVVQVQGLRFGFGEHFRIDGLSFEVRAGEVFGLLGHNGAGKTTTVRLLNGLLQPEGGRLEVLGLNPISQGPQVRARTGVLTETPGVDERLTARQTLRFFAQLYGVRREGLEACVDAALATFGLEDRADERTARFSKGMRQRLALARTLLHDPELLFLDEPTSGLDPLAIRALHDLVLELRGRGRAIVLCTHNLAEAEQLCDRIAVLEQGRLLALGTRQQLAESVPSKAPVEIELEPTDLEPAAWALRRVAGVEDVQVAGGALRASAPRRQIPALVATLVGAGARVYRVAPREPTLEDVYLALHAGERRP